MKRQTILLGGVALLLMACGGRKPVGSWMVPGQGVVFEFVDGGHLNVRLPGEGGKPGSTSEGHWEILEDNRMAVTMDKKTWTSKLDYSKDGQSMYMIGEGGDTSRLLRVEGDTAAIYVLQEREIRPIREKLDNEQTRKDADEIGEAVRSFIKDNPGRLPSINTFHQDIGAYVKHYFILDKMDLTDSPYNMTPDQARGAGINPDVGFLADELQTTKIITVRGKYGAAFDIVGNGDVGEHFEKNGNLPPLSDTLRGSGP